jgi:cytochrome c553
MKKYRIFMLAIAFTGSIAFISSCKKDKNETNISQAGETKSHNMGKNCFDCHKSGGSGKGWFTIAGTVYDSTQSSTYANAVVKLYTQQNGAGTLKATVYGDGNGNFFTTEAYDLSAGVYPSVMGTGGAVKYMMSSVTTGACNSCHGVSVGKLWAK